VDGTNAVRKSAGKRAGNYADFQALTKTDTILTTEFAGSLYTEFLREAND
jgi:hypothetical protein